jgi:ketosteroid isomerase-like protein
MSQEENLERLRVAYDNFLTSGLSLDMLTEDVEFRQPDESGGGDGVYYGHAGVLKGVRELVDVFEELNAVPEEFLLADPYIVVLVRLQGRAKASGVPIDQPYAHVWRFRGDRVDLWHAYSDRQEALRFAGLAE